MARLVAHRQVVSIQRRRLIALLDGRAVVDERTYRHARRQRRHAADVIGVVVRDHQIVDAREAGLLHGGGDAVGVAIVEADEAGVDQHRLAAWRHQQRRLPAFDVDEMDFERFGRLGPHRLGGRGERSGGDQ